MRASHAAHINTNTSTTSLMHTYRPHPLIVTHTAATSTNTNTTTNPLGHKHLCTLKVCKARATGLCTGPTAPQKRRKEARGGTGHSLFGNASPR